MTNMISIALKGHNNAFSIQVNSRLNKIIETNWRPPGGCKSLRVDRRIDNYATHPAKGKAFSRFTSMADFATHSWHSHAFGTALPFKEEKGGLSDMWVQC